LSFNQKVNPICNIIFSADSVTMVTDALIKGRCPMQWTPGRLFLLRHE
jgi:hypothetical protein